ncbi:hypothetical protein DQ04_03451020 [Trypanosoma grayi]|uniref:hypothetical protein n=1 Tax=Trypanosoma grayi TaxID=71804 RepID=UPI0004F45925|nr:hypothetical protein DQ04_03451020 [Trypanosoma grayi]KEG10660.1 hypothetical protein DQ04_03451020 [Trypanosoma grayi]
MPRLIQRLLPSRWPLASPPEPSPGADGDDSVDAAASGALPTLSTHDTHKDRLPFWRRLLCAPEVPELNTRTSPLLQDSAGDASSSLGPSVFSVAAAATTSSKSNNSSLRASRSLFAGPPLLGERDGASCADAPVASQPPCPAACWTVTDTRRAAPEPNGAASAAAATACCTSFPPSSSLACHTDLTQLKQAQKEQLKEVTRRKRELLRDEEALLEEERRRLGLLACRFSVDGAQGEASPGAALTMEALAQHEAENFKAAAGGMVVPRKTSIADTEEETGFVEGDDAIDLQDLNRLYEYYKRREGIYSTPVQEDSVSSPASVRAAAVPLQTQPIKKTRSYSLYSRQYIERVVLAQRSQQLMALMWLLAESMRHAWKLHLRLAQLYFYYVPICLRAAAAESALGKGEDADADAIMKNRYYSYFCSGNFDYEYYAYHFSQEWDPLFADVLNYLKPDSADDDTTPGGSVGAAATVLYSMELFERQRELQLAVREADIFVRSRWQCINDPSALTAIPPPVAVPQPAAAAAAAVDNNGGSGDNGTEEGGAQVVSASPTNDTAEKPVEEATYVPVDWWSAQDADVRAHVSWNRKKRKLRQIRLSVTAKDKSRRLEGADHDTATAAAAAAAGTPTIEELTPVAIENLLEDCSDEESQSHHIVNVGCFGFSFFSRWD